MTTREAFKHCLDNHFDKLSEISRMMWKHRFDKGKLSENKMIEILKSVGYSIKTEQARVWNLPHLTQ